MPDVSAYRHQSAEMDLKPSRPILPEADAESPLIVIVDDDSSFRTAIARLLRLWGFRIESFGSAEEFLQHRTGPHCLILDLHLGGMSGLELQTRLAEDGRQVPIVFVTAVEDAMVRRRALDGGAAAYLEKPFDERRLLEVLLGVIDYHPE